MTDDGFFELLQCEGSKTKIGTITKLKIKPPVWLDKTLYNK